MKKSNKQVINAEILEYMSDADNIYKNFKEQIEFNACVKVGDCVILMAEHEDNDGNCSWKPVLNSYAVPVKYKAVHISELGMPYFQKLNAKGHTFGQLVSNMPDIQNMAKNEDVFIDDIAGESWYPVKFVIDPDYADALILQDEHFDPAVLQRNKAQIHREITKHNKEARINTRKFQDLVTDIFETAVVGQVFYTSAKKSFTVSSIRKEPKQHFDWKHKYQNIKLQNNKVTILTVTDHRGKTRDIDAYSVIGSALYKVQPRSYRELKDSVL